MMIDYHWAVVKFLNDEFFCKNSYWIVVALFFLEFLTSLVLKIKIDYY